MTTNATAPTQPSELLADPTQVALLRELFAHARQVKALHNTYAFVGVTGRPYGNWEHLWLTGRDIVSFEDGRLTYKRNGVLRLTAEVSGLREAVDLLAALDILPPQFSSAYEAGLDSASEVVDAARKWSEADQYGSYAERSAATFELHDAIGCYDNREAVTE